jgi:6-phosphogluconolactonase (cycloisomerase 2 family)
MALIGLNGCGSSSSSSTSSSSNHTAYVTLGSTDKVAAFRVDGGSGGLSAISGSPYPTGISPATLVVHPSHKFAYVSNSGEGTISLFTISNSGALTEVMPRTPAGDHPTAMATDSNGAYLFVGNLGTNTISSYSIDSSTGALTPVAGSPFPLENPIALRVSGNYLYVASPDLSAVAVFSFSGGVLAQIAGSPVFTGYIAGTTTATSPSALTIDPTGTYLYTASPGTSSFSGFIIGSTGGLTPISGSPYLLGTTSVTTTTATPLDLTVDPSGKFLYFASTNSNNVYGYSLGSGTGAPTALSSSPVSAGTAPTWVVADTSGKFLYVGNRGSTNISLFTLDPVAGGLTNEVLTVLPSASTAMTVVP